MSRRKDYQRLLRLRQENPDYAGFRGAQTVTTRAPSPLETVVCSVCNRKRNVAADTIPANRDEFVCLSCQDPESSTEDETGD